MQEEPKPTPKPKKKRISTRVLLIVFGLLLLVAAIGVILYFAVIKDNRPVVDCQKIISDSKKLYADKKYKESYELIKPNLDKCSKENSSTNAEKVVNNASDKASKRELYTNLATAAYKSGDTEQAKKYAEESLEIAKTLTPEERSNLPDNNKLVRDAFEIKNGYYR